MFPLFAPVRARGDHVATVSCTRRCSMASSCTAVEEAVLLSCDIPTRQYILHVDQEQQRELKKESFVIRQLDPTHLYIKAQVSPDTRHGAR